MSYFNSLFKVVVFLTSKIYYFGIQSSEFRPVYFKVGDMDPWEDGKLKQYWGMVVASRESLGGAFY